jgi:hypothetical protein
MSEEAIKKLKQINEDILFPVGKKTSVSFQRKRKKIYIVFS